MLSGLVDDLINRTTHVAVGKDVNNLIVIEKLVKFIQLLGIIDVCDTGSSGETIRAKSLLGAVLLTTSGLIIKNLGINYINATTGTPAFTNIEYPDTIFTNHRATFILHVKHHHRCLFFRPSLPSHLCKS